MNLRIAWSMFASVLILAVACNPVAAAADSNAAATHADKERALRAQIERMDDDIQKLDSQLYALENDHSGNDPSRAAKEDALHDQISRMDRDQELVEDRLNELEKDDPPRPPISPLSPTSSTPAETTSSPASPPAT